MNLRCIPLMVLLAGCATSNNGRVSSENTSITVQYPLSEVKSAILLSAPHHKSSEKVRYRSVLNTNEVTGAFIFTEIADASRFEVSDFATTTINAQAIGSNQTSIAILHVKKFAYPILFESQTKREPSVERRRIAAIEKELKKIAPSP